MKIMVLHNKPSSQDRSEQDTVLQAKEVESALLYLGYEAVRCAFEDGLIEIERFLKREEPDLVFNLAEAFQGEDRSIYLIPAMLEAHKIKYTGCQAEGFFLSGNKILAKQWLMVHGIATPTMEPVEGVHHTWIIKSTTKHASFGLDESCVVTGYEKAEQLLRKKQLQYNDTWFAERYIEGREINVSIIQKNGEPHVLPMAEIQFKHFDHKPKIVDYKAKWDEESEAYHNTPRVFLDTNAEVALIRKLHEISVQCWRGFKLKGYARVDFRVDHLGDPYVLEINANPALSEDAGFIAAAKEAGMSYDRVIETLIEEALHEKLYHTEDCLSVG